MDIEDAFTQETIAASGVDVAGEDEEELRKVAQQLYHNSDLELMTDEARQHENIALLFFVAGRNYQYHNQRVPIFMTPAMLARFGQFLVDLEGE